MRVLTEHITHGFSDAVSVDMDRNPGNSMREDKEEEKEKGKDMRNRDRQRHTYIHIHAHVQFSKKSLHVQRYTNRNMMCFYHLFLYIWAESSR